MDIQTVGFIGAGVMGAGVAQNLAQTGHRVILVDIGDEILQAAGEQIRNNLRFQGFFNKKETAVEPDAALERIQFSTDYNALASADYVVENVNEKWEVKRAVYALLDALCPAHCIFAANTSAISISYMVCSMDVQNCSHILMNLKGFIPFDRAAVCYWVGFAAVFQGYSLGM